MMFINAFVAFWHDNNNMSSSLCGSLFLPNTLFVPVALFLSCSVSLTVCAQNRRNVRRRRNRKTVGILFIKPLIQWPIVPNSNGNNNSERRWRISFVPLHLKCVFTLLLFSSTFHGKNGSQSSTNFAFNCLVDLLFSWFSILCLVFCFLQCAPCHLIYCTVSRECVMDVCVLCTLFLSVCACANKVWVCVCMRECASFAFYIIICY